MRSALAFGRHLTSRASRSFDVGCRLPSISSVLAPRLRKKRAPTSGALFLGLLLPALPITIAPSTLVAGLSSRFMGASSSTDKMSATPAESRASTAPTSSTATTDAPAESKASSSPSTSSDSKSSISAISSPQIATLAAGCFWSVELAYQRVPGVLETAVGFTQGDVANPRYDAVCTGRTGHTEAVQIQYNPSEVSYESLLDIFWKKHDPTTLNRQGNDVGSQYRSGIYYHTDEQKAVAEESKKKQQAKYRSPIVTEILPAKPFYPAEEYHQKYLEKGGQCAAKGCKDSIRCYG